MNAAEKRSRRGLQNLGLILAWLGFGFWAAALSFLYIPGLDELRYSLEDAFYNRSEAAGETWVALFHWISILSLFLGVAGLIIYGVGHVRRGPSTGASRTQRAMKRIERFTSWSGRYIAYLILPMTFVVLFEVAARKVFDSPTYWAHETTIFIYGCHFMLGMAFTYLLDRHVRIDIIVIQTPERIQLWLRVITFTVIFVPFLGIIFLSSVGYAIDSWINWEHESSAWAPPVYWFKSIIPLSVLMLILQGVAHFLRDLKKLRGEDL